MPKPYPRATESEYLGMEHSLIYFLKNNMGASDAQPGLGLTALTH